MPSPADLKLQGHFRAAGMLVIATSFWGLTFPLMKGLLLAAASAGPAEGALFLTSALLAFRFLGSLLIFLAGGFFLLRQTTRNEWWQSLGLSFFGGVGLYLQMDALHYIPASTSAFLTQFYCLVIPLFLALRFRRLPDLVTWICCLMVLGGVAVLADWKPGAGRLGRGEWETLLGSILFAGQILWLQRPVFQSNSPQRVTCLMTGLMGLGFVLVASVGGPVIHLARTVFSDLMMSLVLICLTVLCTALAFYLMNRFQPEVGATEASLIYASEPLFASVLALFLPAWLSTWLAVEYHNETLTFKLVTGGALITIANVLMQARNLLKKPCLTGR